MIIAGKFEIFSGAVVEFKSNIELVHEKKTKTCDQ